MQETPPHTLLEMKLLLSQYLDGALTAEQTKTVDELLSQFPQYVEELQKLKKTRDALQSSLGIQSGEGPDLRLANPAESAWGEIAKRMKVDQEQPARLFDSEFISAYYDGEIPALDADFIAFESQLYHNTAANELLAGMGEISETVRQFGYRLENACSLDIAGDVMATFLSESAGQVITGDLPEASENVELVSAYADQALSPRETIEANRLIERDAEAKHSLGQFNRISEGIASVSLQIQAQSPDLWPAVSTILQKSPAEGGLVVVIDRFRQLKRWSKIVAPVAAAVLLVALVMPAHQNPSIVAKTVSIPSGKMVTAGNAKDSGSRYTEIASVPAQGIEEAQLAMVGEASSDVVTPIAASSAVALRTSFRSRLGAEAEVDEPHSLRKVAARPPQAIVDVPGTITGPSPSSEEYLFNALNEQMPGEDVSSILGK